MMNLESNGRAVTPVVGIVLIVAITIILAAVIGVFGLGYGEELTDPSRQAGITLEATSASSDPATPSVLRVTLEGGDTLHADETKVTITYGDSEWVLSAAPTDDNPLTVGKTAVIKIDDSGPGDTVMFVDSTVWSDYSNVTQSGTDEFGNVEITVEVIDTNSDKIIYEASATG